MTTWSALISCGGQAAGDGAADDGAQADGAAPLEDREERVFLDVHGADQRNVGPGEIAVAQALDVGVDEALVPRVRQQGGDGHQAQRRLCGTLAHELERMFEAPIGIGKLRIDQ